MTVPIRTSRSCANIAHASRGVAVAGFFVVCVGCGDKGTPGAAQNTDVTQSGKIVAFGKTAGIAGVTVALGDRTGTTDANGLYTISLPKETPYEMVLTAAGYFKVIGQEWKLTTNVIRTNTNFVSELEWATFIPAFERFGGVARDPALGFIALLVTARPPCATTGGATVTVTPSVPTTRYVYIDDTGAPSANTSTTSMPFSVHVIVYNVPIGPVAMAITNPTCTQVPFPIITESVPDGGTYTDTGIARVESGKAVSYLRVFLGG